MVKIYFNCIAFVQFLGCNSFQGYFLIDYWVLEKVIQSPIAPFVFLRSIGNRAYPLKMGSSLELHVYCHMTNDLGACGGSGWTLIMKTDGNKVSFCT